MTPCPGCGARTPATAAFCQSCGWRLTEPPIRRALAVWLSKATLIAWAGVALAIALVVGLSGPTASPPSAPLSSQPWSGPPATPVDPTQVAAIAATAAARAAADAEAGIAWRVADREAAIIAELSTRQAGNDQAQTNYLVSLMPPRSAPPTPAASPPPVCQDGLAPETTCLLPTATAGPTRTPPACPDSIFRSGGRQCRWQGSSTPTRMLAPTSRPIPDPPGVPPPASATPEPGLSGNPAIGGSDLTPSTGSIPSDS